MYVWKKYILGLLPMYRPSLYTKYIRLRALVVRRSLVTVYRRITFYARESCEKAERQVPWARALQQGTWETA